MHPEEYRWYRRAALLIPALSTFFVLQAPGTAHATTLAFGFELAGDFNHDGDTLINLIFTDNATQEIYGGQGVRLAATSALRLGTHEMHEAQVLLNIGLKYSTMLRSQNANLDFVRVPLEVLGFYHNKPWHLRAGAGLLVNLHTSLRGSGALSFVDVTFRPALGAILQADFVWQGWTIGIRYTLLQFRPTNVDVRLRANSVGFTLGYLSGSSS